MKNPHFAVCNCDPGDAPVHLPECAVNEPENLALISNWYAAKRDGCGRYGHMERESNEWGMGGRVVDFFCPNCKAHIETVRPDQLTREERNHIFGAAIDMLEGFAS